jgi:predicted nuclease of restriction endonuclease-like (RecB) superfamily
MITAVMQPYLFPYLGYFQLINCSDNFVIYDDVNYIKNGYINRNYILSNGEKQRITIPVLGASSNKKIKELCYSADVKKVLVSIQQAYSKAPYFKEVYSLIEKVLEDKNRSISEICRQSYIAIFNYLGIKKNFVKSSDLEYNRANRPEERLVELTKYFDSNKYVNAIGGKELYCKDYFKNNGIELSFIAPGLPKYEQGAGEFIVGLSIIDILMWCEIDTVKGMLNTFRFE